MLARYLRRSSQRKLRFVLKCHFDEFPPDVTLEILEEQSEADVIPETKFLYKLFLRFAKPASESVMIEKL